QAFYAREICTFLNDLFIVAARQFIYETVRTDKFSCTLHLFKSHLAVVKLNIRRWCPVKNKWILQHQTDVFFHYFFKQSFNRMSVNFNTAMFKLVKPHH